MIVLRLFYLHARGACITIQRHVRGHQHRRRYKALRAAVITLQAVARMAVARPRHAERLRKKRDEIRKRIEEEKQRRAAEEERKRRDEDERRKQAKKVCAVHIRRQPISQATGTTYTKVFQTDLEPHTLT